MQELAEWFQTANGLTVLFGSIVLLIGRVLYWLMKTRNANAEGVAIAKLDLSATKELERNTVVYSTVLAHHSTINVRDLKARLKVMRLQKTELLNALEEADNELQEADNAQKAAANKRERAAENLANITNEINQLKSNIKKSQKTR